MQLKKTFTFVLCFEFCVLSFATPVAALDPIIIDSATFSAPPSQQPPTNDINYYSNDILKYNVSCNGPATIAETFEPHCIISDMVTKTKICHPYAVMQVKGKVCYGKNNYLNLWYRDAYNHFANRPKAIDEINFPSTMTNFNLDALYGANNASSRSTPSQLLTCLKGQRLIQAIRSLENRDNRQYQATVNEAVAWSDGTSYVANQTRPDLQPVRLVDIAIAMADLPFLDPETCEPDPEGNTVYYDPNVDCTPTTKPMAFPGVSGYQKTRITPRKACELLKYSVQVGDIGSNARIVRIEDSLGVQKKETSIPLGNLSTNSDIPKLLLSYKQPVPPVNVCATTPQVESQDKANTICFDLVANEYFGTVYDTPKTFQKTFVRTYWIDPRIPETFATYKVALNNLLPRDTQLKYGTQEFNSSAEDKKHTLDPGNNIVEKVFYKLMWSTNSP